VSIYISLSIFKIFIVSVNKSRQAHLSFALYLLSVIVASSVWSSKRTWKC